MQARVSLPSRQEAEPQHNGAAGIPALLSRLSDDFLSLMDSKLTLLKVEIKEEARSYVRGGVGISVGSVIAAIGFVFVNVAAAFGISTLFSATSLSQPAKYALGFVLTGVTYLIVGGVVIAVIRARLSKQDLVPPRSVEELRKDRIWLKTEL